MNGTDIFNGMFGRIDAGLVRLDVNSNIAVKTTNGYKSYSTKDKRLINCDSFVFDIGEEFFFVIPTNKVEVNDIILATGKNGKRVPKCVIDVNDSYITVINYEDSVVENILPERHVFMGSTYFYGKIVSMFNFKDKKNNGFENILKFKMLSEMMNGTTGTGNGQNNMMGNMMMLSMMSNGGLNDMFNFGEMFSFNNNNNDDDNNTTAKENK